ncbi:MAG: B12-binding domain-containing radical SAM protein [Armatimonadota bacterium]
MRILIVVAGEEQSSQPVVALGAHLVASAARAAGHEVEILDPALHVKARHRPGRLEQLLQATSFDLIGLSIHSTDTGDVLAPRSRLTELTQLVATCRRLSAAPIVLGGAAVGCAPEALCRALRPDYAVLGEGERAFAALLDTFRTGESPAAIRGVMVVSDGSIKSASPPSRSKLADLPVLWPACLTAAAPAANGPAWPVETKRGCNQRCLHCAYPSVNGASWRPRDPQRVAEELALGQAAGLRSAEIVDASFGLPGDHALECCEAMANRLNGALPLSTMSLHPRAVTPTLVTAMEAAGFSAVGIDAISGSSTILRNLRRGYVRTDLHRASWYLRDLQAQRLWVFRLGAPGETPATLLETIQFIESLHPSDLVVIHHGLRVWPGTQLHRLLVAGGELSEETNLLEPTYYYSPHLTPTQAEEILAQHRDALHNRLPSAGMRGLAQAVQKTLSLCGLQPPYWRQSAGAAQIRRSHGV